MLEKYRCSLNIRLDGWIFMAKRKNNLYILNTNNDNALVSETEINCKPWHNRLIHPGFDKLKRIFPNAVNIDANYPKE